MRAGAEVHSPLPECGRRALPVSCVATFAGVRPGGGAPRGPGRGCGGWCGGQVTAGASLRAPRQYRAPAQSLGPPLRDTDGELSPPPQLPKQHRKAGDLGREVERGELVS